MADTGRLRAEKGRRRFRDLFKRSSQTTTPSTTSTPQAPTQPSSTQLLSTALPSSPSLDSNQPQVPAPSSPPVLEAPTVPLSGQQSTTSLNLWQEVFGKVNKETQEWIQKQGLKSLASVVAKPEDQIKQLTDLIKEKEKIFEEKDSPLKIKIGNQEIIFRAYIADVIGFLTMAGDVAINFAPPQVSVPWAAAKAVLKIPFKQIEQMAALAGTIQLFTRIVCRGQVYEILYNNAISTKEGTVSNLRNALVDLYVSAIQLLAQSGTLFESGIVRQTLNTILRPEQAAGLISDLLEKERMLSYEVQSYEALRNEEATKQIDEGLRNVLAKLDVISSPLTRIDGGVAKLLENVNDYQLEKIMDFISSEQFGRGHATIKDTRIKNTGDWLINHESFQDWQCIASSSTLLCLQGTVGTGKTYLTSRVIDHVKQTLEASPHDEGFAFFYCTRSGPSMQDPLTVLRSFVRQLSYKANNYSCIQSKVIQRCSIAKREGRGLSYTDCKDLILESMNLYSKTTIILDALDESDITSYNLAEIMIDLMDKAIKPVKIFISSRPNREFLEAFEAKATIMVNSNNQQGDIEKYLAEILPRFRWVYLQTKSLQKCVSDDAIRTWAKTIPRDLMAAYDRLWDDLENQHNESDMALAVRAIKWVLCSFIPLTSRILLEAIRYAHKGDRFVRIELRTEQEILSLCQDLLTVDVARGVWMLPHASVAEYFESKGMVLGECDAFVSKILLEFLMTPKLESPSDMDKDSDQETADTDKDFNQESVNTNMDTDQESIDTDVDSDLESVHMRVDYDSEVFNPQGLDELKSIDTARVPERFKRYVKRAWFKHIRRYDKPYGLVEYKSIDTAGVPEMFESYVIRNWFKHVQRYDKWLDSLEGTCPETELTALLKRFLGSPGDSSGYYRRWMKSLVFGKLEPTNMALLVMCRYGFYYTLRDWWEKGKIDQSLALTEGKGSLEYGYDGYLSFNLLDLAAMGGCMPICRYLVSVIGVIGHQGRYCRAASKAISRGNKTAAKLLVEAADVDFNTLYSDTDWTLAQFTAMHGASGMLQWAMDQGWVDVNRQGGVNFGNALIAAAKEGTPQSVEMLLRAGADANAIAECGKYGSALIAAAAAFSFVRMDHCEKKIVALLDSGADVNQIPSVGNYGSALESCIWRAFYVAQSIYRPRYMVQFIDENRNARIVELLLKAGADPAIACNVGEHGSALAAAAFFGLKDFLVMMVNAAGRERAIECLQQSRHPSRVRFHTRHRSYRHNRRKAEAWRRDVAEIATYLAVEVGVDKETLRGIGVYGVTFDEDHFGGYYIRSN
ncbi:hypothetical protein ACSS6W_003975 [Trichoderma asperelloides]